MLTSIYCNRQKKLQRSFFATTFLWRLVVRDFTVNGSRKVEAIAGEGVTAEFCWQSEVSRTMERRRYDVLVSVGVNGIAMTCYLITSPCCAV